MRAFFSALMILGALAAWPAAAHQITAGDLTIIHPMARPAIGARPSAAYMAIVNDGAKPERLLGARSPAFESAELHESVREGGVSKMRPVDGLDIPAGDTALLEPGGLHLMLMGGKGTLKPGDEFPLTLIFQHAGEVEVTVKVGDMGDAGGAGMHHDHAAPATQ